VAGWTDDPELVTIFRAEVDEKLSALRDGLLRLEGLAASGGAAPPKQLVASLFRDAHTVKGSARALGLEQVVSLAHRSEDLLGAVRDGRFGVRRDLVDLLLAATDGIGAAMPGAERPSSEEDVAALVAALDRALAGEDPVEVPRPSAPPEPEPASDADPVVEPAGRRGEVVRVPTRRVRDLLDVVGEAELETRKLERTAGHVGSIAAEQLDLARRLRTAVVHDTGLPADVTHAVHALVALGDQLHAAARELRGRVEDAQARLASVRDGAMGLAMVPVRRVVASFPQLVREVAQATGKDVRLVLEGEDVELDTRVLDGVADALSHLVTNAVDHGCEAPAARRAAGKPATATVRVTARAAGSTVVVEVADDGTGIDEDALREAAVAAGLLPAGTTASGQPLLAQMFVPGFSTRTVVTETSGRGVGLDVVRTAVDDLGGSVEVESALGVGTTFVITLPVTLGVMRCLVARVGDERYALPVTNVVETLNLKDVEAVTVAGAPVLLRHGVSVPLADLGGAVGATGPRSARSAVVVRYGSAGEQLAWAVDVLESELELVVKDLGPFLGRLPALGGATIDADGSVLLLLDLRELALQQVADPGTALRRSPGVDLGGAPGAAADRPHGTDDGGPAGPGAHAADRTDQTDRTDRTEPAPADRGRGALASAARAVERRARVLVVEDSVGVRELQRVILEAAGYEVLTAVDGADGAARLGGDPVDLVLTDVEMPGMDGFTLTRQIRRTPAWAEVPVVIMTSRGDDADKRAGLDAGASAYLLKSEFDQADLVGTVRRLVGR
jgi:chemotaxis protein histidine kinase CheA